MTFTIVQTAFLGDVVIALSMAQSLKQYDSTCRVVFVTTPAGAEFASFVPEIDEVVVYDKRNSHKGLSGIAALAKTLRSMRIDVLFAPHRSFRTSFLCALSGATKTIGFTNNSLSWLYSFVVPYNAASPEHVRNHALLAFWNENVPLRKTRFSDGEIAQQYEHVIQSFELPKKYVALAPGSVWATKRYPTASYAEIVKTLVANGIECITVGSSADAEQCRALEKAGARNVCGKTTLQEFVGIVAGAEIVIGNDSSPTHVANAVNTPVVCIFGPTVPAFGFAPTGEKDIVVENLELDCRPCSPHGTASCPRHHFKCMNDVAPATVVEAALNVMENSR